MSPQTQNTLHSPHTHTHIYIGDTHDALAIAPSGLASSDTAAIISSKSFSHHHSLAPSRLVGSLLLTPCQSHTVKIFLVTIACSTIDPQSMCQQTAITMPPTSDEYPPAASINGTSLVADDQTPDAHHEAFDADHTEESPGASPAWPSLLQICVNGDTTMESSKPELTASHTPTAILCKRAGAEFVGTFLLIFSSAGSTIMNEKTNGGLTYMGVGLAAGLAVMLVIFSTGHISGAHLNPAVTLAFATIKEFPWPQVPLYFVSQLVASIVASFVLKVVMQPYDGAGGVTVPSGTLSQAFVVEFIITFCLMFVVTAVATDNRAVGELAGIAVGATVILNNLVAGAITGASMNPVRTLGPAIVAGNFRGLWVYIFGPVMGALGGSATYTLVRFKSPDGTVGTSIRRR